MRNLDILLTSEMTKEEWQKFRHKWVVNYCKELQLECGVNFYDASLIADIRFENYVGQEGFTARNELIADSREEL